MGDVNLDAVETFTLPFHIDHERAVGGAAPKLFVVVDGLPSGEYEAYIAKGRVPACYAEAHLWSMTVRARPA